MRLVCGVHGVGKTIFSRKLAKITGLNCYSAGEIIQEKKKVQIKKDKVVSDVLGNQKILFEALSEIKEEDYVLDGHLCLIMDNNVPERIPCEIFKKMNITNIYIILDDAKQIKHNLENRDHVKWSIEFISRFQEEELSYAKFLSERMNIPLKIILNNKEIDCSPLSETNSIILPIKPKFVELIFAGEKKYEYRKKLCKRNIDKIYIYATAPQRALVGEVCVSKMVSKEKEKLWKESFEYSGISKLFYDKYFEKQSNACAYLLGNVKKYNRPIELKQIGINYVPQSFVYVYESLEESIQQALYNERYN